MRSLLLATVLTLGAAGGPLVARADTANNYNLFVIGNMSVQGSDEEGRTAVGGDASMTAHSVGLDASPSTVNLVVGGNFKGAHGAVNGATIVGGSVSLYDWSPVGIEPAGTPVPVDLASEAVRLDDLTSTLAGYAANGSVSYVGTGAHDVQTTMTGTDANLNVFDLSGLEASETSVFTINITPGSIALINTNGVNDVLSDAYIQVNGGDASDILWNFSDATSLSFRDIGMVGSALAPNAAYAGTGVISGQLIVDSFSDYRRFRATQVNDVMFAGNLLAPAPSAVPEPSVWALLLSGFTIMGGALRLARRRQRRPTLSPSVA